MDGKQLSDRSRDEPRTLPTFSAPLELDRRCRGESKLRRRILPMTKIGCSVLGDNEDDRNSLQKLMWRSTASSMVISFCDRVTSSLTASAQRPQSQWPWNRWRRREMYAGVHSSVKPHESHWTDSTSTTTGTWETGLVTAAEDGDWDWDWDWESEPEIAMAWKCWWMNQWIGTQFSVSLSLLYSCLDWLSVTV